MLSFYLRVGFPNGLFPSPRPSVSFPGGMVLNTCRSEHSLANTPQTLEPHNTDWESG